MSGKICDEYAIKDSRIKVIHQENKGAATARNTGIRAAKGEYLIFVDGDDYIADSTLQLLKETLKYKQYDVILSEGMYRVKRDKIYLEIH